MKNNPLLTEKTAQAIEKIQAFGYDFAYEISTGKYQAGHINEEGNVEAEYEFDNWEQIIAFADNITKETL